MLLAQIEQPLPSSFVFLSEGQVSLVELLVCSSLGFHLIPQPR